jgi:hypothetical protein
MYIFGGKKINGKFVCLDDLQTLKVRYGQGIFIDVLGGTEQTAQMIL